MGSEREPGPCKRRRYKLILDPNCDPALQLSQKTIKTWNEASQKKVEEIKLKRSLETCTSEVHLDYLSRGAEIEKESTDYSVIEEETIDFDSDENSDSEYDDSHSDVETASAPTVEESCTNKSNMFDQEDTVMFEKSGITINDVVQMIVAFSIRFGVTHHQRDWLLEMFKICAGEQFKHVKLSNYQISKVCDPPPDKIVYHFYCDQCSEKKEVLKSCLKSEIKNNKVVCSNCEKTHTIFLGNPNYFLSIDLEYQLQLLFQKEEVADCLTKKLTSELTESSGIIRDVNDSELHKALINSNNNVLTFTMSTDGAPLFKMSKRSFWPLQVILNFLSPLLRFKHVLLTGVMIVSKEPKPDLMNLFIITFFEQMRRLFSEGLKQKLPMFDDEFIIKFAIFCIVADSVARPVLQNRIQFNGYHPCSYCYHPGLHIDKAGIRLPFLDDQPELRTHKSHLNDVEDVKKLLSSSLRKKNVRPTARGVKGPSAFIDEGIDMVWGLPLDYVHNAVLGVAEQVWEDINKNDLSPQQRREVDELLLQIQPPHDLHPIPEKISSKGVWKATHWKSWLLYYSVPILTKFVSDEEEKGLSKEKLAHYALLVNSVHTLLKLEITEIELKRCERNLIIFVAQFQFFYGIEKMTFNVHILLHLVRSVTKSGPLWATSAFPFEHNIFSLKNLVNGTKGIEQQMATKSLTRLAYEVAPVNPRLSDKVNEYCKELFAIKTFTKSCVTFENITLLCPSAKNKFQAEQEFGKCIRENTIFCGTKYLKSNKFNDTVVQLRSKKIVQITRISLVPNIGCQLEVVELVLEPFTAGNIQINHIWKVLKNIEHAPIAFYEIESKVIVLDFKSGEQFVCVICNNIEAQ